MDKPPGAPEPPKSVFSTLEAWGKSSVAPMALATLITALHYRPFQPRPMLFVPILLFSSYANLQGFKIDGAGLTAAASGTYALLALRRRPGPLAKRFLTPRGAVRGVALGLAGMNTVAGGWVYARGNRELEKRERKENPRWV
ncbi:hypothetical protein F4778DRAFT_745706 [Xylariomycetidae sp. FL2044]|nr:hypothetical protein F4778DRAFT_745706 [Xylariomycetidae sp. FL2044]